MRTKKEAEGDDIAGYWRGARGLPALPEVFYFVVTNGGFDNIALHRIRCTGEILRSNMAPYKPKWLGIREALLWSGKLYKPSPVEDPDKAYSYYKHNVDLTLDDAIDRIHAAVADYEHEAERNLKQIEESISKLREHRDILKEHLHVLEGFALSVRDLK